MVFQIYNVNIIYSICTLTPGESLNRSIHFYVLFSYKLFCLSGWFINWTCYGDTEDKRFERWENGTSYSFSWWRILFRFVNIFIVINQYIYFIWLCACVRACMHACMGASERVCTCLWNYTWMYTGIVFTFWVIFIWPQWLLNFALCIPPA